MRKILPIIVLLFASVIFADGKQENFDEILHRVLPQELKNVRMIQKRDLSVYKKYGTSIREGKAIYEANTEAFEQGKVHAYLQRDINNNGYEEVVLSCIDSAKHVYYLVILEKQNKYELISFFKFDSIFSITGAENNDINLSFQTGTDWSSAVRWDGKEYNLVQPGSMEP